MAALFNLFDYGSQRLWANETPATLNDKMKGAGGFQAP